MAVHDHAQRPRQPAWRSSRRDARERVDRRGYRRIPPGSCRCARTSSIASSCWRSCSRWVGFPPTSARCCCSRPSRSCATRKSPACCRFPIGTVMSRLSRARDKLRQTGRRARVVAARDQVNRERAMSPASPSDVRRRCPRVRRRPARARSRGRASRRRSPTIRELAARVADIRAQNAALRDALDPVLAEPIPDAAARRRPCARRARRAPRGAGRWASRSRWRPRSRRSASASAGSARDALIERAGHADDVRAAGGVRARAVRERRQPAGRDLGDRGKSGSSTGSPSGSGFSVHAPDLNGVGYALVGGAARRRQREADGALHVRERRQGAPVAAGAQAARPAPAETGVPLRRTKTASACSTGSTMTCGYAISGKLDRAQLLEDRARRLRPARRRPSTATPRK